ncbi:MAG: ATP-binding cassette domain-containing protein [Gammaproteobacteria bacterium]|uniref:ATP-binding cassette domain-containing protein n=1 Tax=Candidatus Thiopontia autotrophica TaxID=2841688 RepID=A0A8J6P786_9GAMM|nr:ATP-binding cassette domain-containing protein [Candidatus Thiopontia autotrophica]MBL6968819.1 ATP-binding cassette domain-containing protein [Gammaproteobacteria bacterium]
MDGLSLKQLATDHIGPIDLSINLGHSIGLFGPSGSGKTLLLRAIADLDPHQGEITLAGKSQIQYIPKLWRRHVAFFATESQWWGETVKEHMPGPVVPWLEMCGFDQTALQWSVNRLSSGEKQRLAIVRQLALLPSVLLLDEPTSSLDTRNGQRIEKMLLQYQLQREAVLIWVSHDREQLLRVTQRQFEMSEGKIQEITKHAT